MSTREYLRFSTTGDIPSPGITSDMKVFGWDESIEHFRSRVQTAQLLRCLSTHTRTHTHTHTPFRNIIFSENQTTESESTQTGSHPRENKPHPPSSGVSLNQTVLASKNFFSEHWTQDALRISLRQWTTKSLVQRTYLWSLLMTSSATGPKGSVSLQRVKGSELHTGTRLICPAAQCPSTVST